MAAATNPSTEMVRALQYRTNRPYPSMGRQNEWVREIFVPDYQILFNNQGAWHNTQPRNIVQIGSENKELACSEISIPRALIENINKQARELASKMEQINSLESQVKQIHQGLVSEIEKFWEKA